MDSVLQQGSVMSHEVRYNIITRSPNRLMHVLVMWDMLFCGAASPAMKSHKKKQHMVVKK